MPPPGAPPGRPMTDEEFEREMAKGDESDNGPSDDSDSDDNAGNVTVTSLEGDNEDDAMGDEDDVLKDENVEMKDASGPT